MMSRMRHWKWNCRSKRLTQLCIPKARGFQASIQVSIRLHPLRTRPRPETQHTLLLEIFVASFSQWALRMHNLRFRFEDRHTKPFKKNWLKYCSSVRLLFYCSMKKSAPGEVPLLAQWFCCICVRLHRIGELPHHPTITNWGFPNWWRN